MTEIPIKDSKLDRREFMHLSIVGLTAGLGVLVGLNSAGCNCENDSEENERMGVYANRPIRDDSRYNIFRGNLASPCVLIEICNMSNADDAVLLADPTYRQRAAQAIFDGIFAYAAR